MRILILEDDSLIAMDLEDIAAGCTGAQVLVASNVADAMRLASNGLDFALLDLDLGHGESSIPFAEQLRAWRVPFCFVSASVEDIPPDLRSVPQVRKPFHPRQIERVLPTNGLKGGLSRYARPEAGTWAAMPRT